MKKKLYVLFAICLLIFASCTTQQANETPAEVEVELTPQEEAIFIANEKAPIDPEKEAAILDLPLGEEDETWAFYIYMNGSDLEGIGMNNLSNFTQFSISQEVTEYTKAQRDNTLNDITGYINTIQDNNCTIPTVLTQPVYYNSGVDIGAVVPDSGEGEMPENVEAWIASTYISELKLLNIPENVDIIIQPGGALAWQSVDINPNITQRFEIVNHNLVPVYEGPLQNMGNPETLTEFLTFCEENYPADNTVVILWDHGGATRGFGWDAIYGSDNLTLTELREAFEGAYTLDEENPPIDLLYLNACLMSCAETYDYLRGVSEYTLAHQEVGYAGFPFYSEAFQLICDYPQINPAQFAKVIVDSFIENLIFYGNNSISTTSMLVVDSSKASEVYDLYADFARTLLNDVVEDPSLMTLLTRASKATNAMALSSYKGYNTYDLYGFAEYLSPYYPEECAAMMNAIDESVLYYRGTNYHNDSHGISIYFPAYIEDLSCLAIALDYINSISLSDDIKALYYYKIAGCLPEDMQTVLTSKGMGVVPNLDFSGMLDIKKSPAVIDEEENKVYYAITEDILKYTADGYVQLGKFNEDSGYIEYLGQDRYAFVSDDLQNFGINVKGNWVKINGVDFPVSIKESTAVGVTYVSEVIYNNELMNLVLYYDAEEKEMSITDIQPYVDVVDTLSRELVTLEYGEEIIPIYMASDIYGRVREYVIGEPIVIDENTVIEDASLDEGEYLMRLVVEDFRGDRHYSQIIQFGVEEGEVSYIIPSEFLLMSPIVY